MNNDFLSQIVLQKRTELKKKKLFSAFNLRLKARRPKLNRQFKKAIFSPTSLSLIAEIKKASPSRGILVADFNPVKIAKIYQSCGASAISTLTEEKYFQGKLSHIKEVRQNVSLPVLRKDFIIDKYQIYESYRAGSDAILLISELLSQKKLIEFLNLSQRLGLDCLVEVHTQEELKKALDTPAQIIGVNNRNLHNFTVDLNITKMLIPLIPDDKIKVCESGIKTKEDISLLKNLGVNAVLIGEALLEAPDIASKIKELFS
ncbi:MAG: indole-3-glycerol phosphate synthase TrpC [Candidatus Omnitrophota bacterium]|nr:indole-3-glycerol phosphate synthase TrpC [Candidatus Omnitrophota bacterium]